MKQKISLISSLGIAITLLAGLFLPAKPVFSGATIWSAEVIPSKTDYVLGPDDPGDNIDVRDFSMTSNGLVIYAVAGNSITTNVVYKSIDHGVTWTAIDIPIVADFVAVAPDDPTIIAIADGNAPDVYISTDGGTTWDPLGTPQEEGANAAEEIYDIAISEYRETSRCLAIAGKEAGNVANLWYFNIGAPVPTWQETRTLDGFSAADNETRAIAFSGSYSADAALVVISLFVDNAGDDSVRLHVLDTSARKWNASAGYLNYPCNVVTGTGITGLSSASLSLAPGYIASDDDTRTVFIGLTVLGNASAVAASGIYRFVDTAKTAVYTDVPIHSVAFNGSWLVAGSYDSNLVYRCSNPSSTIPSVYQASTTKYPGGDNRVLVSWLNANVVAGTSGDESAFSVSSDYAYSFNDISLIDTQIDDVDNAIDTAVSGNGDTVYLVTSDDDNDVSLWRKTTTWQRVFSERGSTPCIVRISPGNSDYVYLAKRNGTTVYYSSAGGTTQWSVRICNLNIVDMAVESNSVVYALNDAGMVSKSTNSGFSWHTPISSNLGSGATIVSIAQSQLLVGSQHGYVAYSLDANVTWKMIPQILEAGAGKVQVIADYQFASNKIIYAASSTGGQNIRKWKIDTSTEWTDVFKGNINGGVYGLVIDRYTLYALEYSGGQSTLWICLSPTTATATSSSWSSSTTIGTVIDPQVCLNANPRGLKVSSGKVWAVKTNDTNKLYSFTNTTVTFSLLKPASGTTFHTNAFTGIAYDIPFSWERPTLTTEYELDIALNPQFSSMVATVTLATINEVAFVMVGPGQQGDANVNFTPGTAYYWRIRTTEPVFSHYSASKYFFIEPITAMIPEAMMPPSGQENMNQTPAFSWSPIIGATEYQFILSENISLQPPIVDTTLTTCGFAVTQELEYGKTYFWQVRAISPIESDWSPLANFTVTNQPDEPVPLVIVEKRTAPVIELPQQPPETKINLAPPLKPPPPVTPDYLRGAIYIASALILAIAFLLLYPLISRLLPAPAVITGPLKGSSRRVRKITGKLGKAWEEVAARSKGVIPMPVSIATGEAPEIDTLSFAVKSFLYMTASGEKEGEERLLSPEEEKKLGKKLASGIRALAAEKPLYLAFPDDSAQFLQIWARYGSREETDRYLKKSFKGKPENALAFLKRYLPAPESTEEGAAVTQEFTRSEYESLIRVVDPDNVYEPVAKLLKFRFEKEGDRGLSDPLDRSIAYQFVRIHYDIKK